MSPKWTLDATGHVDQIYTSYTYIYNVFEGPFFGILKEAKRETTVGVPLPF